ncbi:hypothetical protein Tco_0608824 [Tanacetum coccineum]
MGDTSCTLAIREQGADRVQNARLQTLRSELEMLKMKENKMINDFSGKIGGIMAKFKSLDSRLDEEVSVRKLLNSAPKKYLPIVASIEQYSEIETMSFEEAMGRLKAYEERLKSHDEKEEEQGGLLLTSSGLLEEEEVGKEVLVEEKEDVEEARVKVIRVDLYAMSVEHLDTSQGSVLNGKTTTMKPT